MRTIRNVVFVLMCAALYSSPAQAASSSYCIELVGEDFPYKYYEGSPCLVDCGEMITMADSTCFQLGIDWYLADFDCGDQSVSFTCVYLMWD